MKTTKRQIKSIQEHLKNVMGISYTRMHVLKSSIKFYYAHNLNNETRIAKVKKEIAKLFGCSVKIERSCYLINGEYRQTKNIALSF